ncbi:MAG: TMEM43 family protein [Alphaproteobacteria bacterium]|nr:TMEM43 family protein [Alphaproteobacteria bacterium]
MSDDSDDGGFDSVTEVTSEGWGSRIFGSIAGVVFGLVLFIVAFPLLIWNESRAVDTATALAEGRAAVVSVKADSIAAANEGHLVYVHGHLSAGETLVPKTVMSEPALKLRREVEVYQWEETKKSVTEKELGGSTTTRTTYSYKKEWSGHLHDSNAFHVHEKHHNPTSMPLENSTSVVEGAKLGAFRLTNPVLNLLNGYHSVPEQAQAALVRRDVHKSTTVQGEWAYAGNPVQPEVGDFRVKYSYVPLTEASVIGRQSDGAIETYTTRNGHELVMGEMGLVSPDSMFKAEEQGNAILTWALRVGGWIAMLIGMMLIVRPLSVLADVIPFLGDVLSAGVFLVAFPVSLCLTLVTVSIAWIMVRPMIGIPLLVVGVALLALPVLRRRRRAAEAK